MTEKPNKTYDLEDRTLEFSKKVLNFCRKLAKDIITRELITQVVRSSTSVGANYIEANEALSKKDFVHRIKISRKETKETVYWIQLIADCLPPTDSSVKALIKEAVELKKILSAIIEKSS